MPTLDTQTLRAAADVLDRLNAGDVQPEDAAVVAAEVRTMLDNLATALSRARETSAAKLYRTGMTARELGGLLGVSRQRAHLLASAGMRQGWGDAGRADAGTDPRAEYDAYLEAAYQAAEAATNGQMVKPKYRSGPNAVDPRRFFWLRGKPPMYAASEELARYWGMGEHWRTADAPSGPRAPLTFTAWQAQQREEQN